MHKKKQQVIRTTKKLFAENGYTGISIQHIIDTCGISKGTFYNYFASKNEFIVAYLETAKKEENRRREALLFSNNTADKDVFVKQVLIRIEIMKEFTLRPIHEEAFYSDDKDLKMYIKNRYIEEIQWLRGRLVQLYGASSEPYASDGAILMHGMIQSMLYTWSILTVKQMNDTLLVQYVVRRMDVLIAQLVQSGDLFFQDIQIVSFQKGTENITKKTILKNIQALRQTFHSTEHALQQHADFLMEELVQDPPRTHLLQSFCSSFWQLSKQTKYEKEITCVVSQVKHYINEI